MKKMKDKNGFLITWGSCILVLLVMCYFGINSNTKGTYASTCADGLTAIGDYCCPFGYTNGVETVNGKKYCTDTHFVSDASEDGGGIWCLVEGLNPGTVQSYNSAGWSCVSTSTNVYSCTSTDVTKCAREAYEASKTYLVSFDGGVYDINVDSKWVVYGEAYGTLPTPDLTTHSFAGWYTSDGTLVTSSTIVTINGDHTLTAQWKPNNVNIDFDPNGGEVDTTSIIAAKGALYGTLPTPTRSGYTFDGWYTAASGGTLITSESTVSYDINLRQTLYAHWTEIPSTYTITYKDGNTVVKTENYEEGTSVTLHTLNNKTGYTFGGWSTSTNACDSNPIPGGTVKSYTGNITFYACWNPVQYTITYKDGSTVVKTDTYSHGSSVTLYTPSDKTGYTFVGWSSASNACDGNPIPGGTVKSYTGDITFYACWQADGKNTNTISFSSTTATYTGSPVSVGASSSSGVTPTITYYTDSSCSTKTSTSHGASGTGMAPADAGTYYVKATVAETTDYSAGTSSCQKFIINKKSIPVTWGSTTSWQEDGSNHAPTVTTPVSGVSGESLNLAVSGAQKTAGTYNATASCSSVSGGRAKCSNYTLTNTTKQFTITKPSSSGSGESEPDPVQYTISYDANGGTGAPSAQTKIENTTLKLSTTVPTRNDYVFLGWSTSRTATTASYSAGGNYTDNKSVTLYAVWEKKTEDTITYTGTFMNGSTKFATKTCSVPSGETTCDMPIPDTNPTKTGYTFKGWSTTQGCDKLQNSPFADVSKDTTYYACFEKNQVTDPGNDGNNDNENVPGDDNNNNDDSGNVTDNPQTGVVVVALSWFAGLFAIAYSVYYFRKVKQN